ncbi:MAG: alpha/beta hydrolase [bacterium]
MSKKQVIFVPGFGLSAPLEIDDWSGWLAEETRKCGFDFKLLSMPDIMYPEIDQWLSFLQEQNIEIDNNTYFVGHSLGCITIARFLEKLPSKSVARGCIFVAGFCSLPKIPFLSDFCNLPLDFSEVKKHAREFVSIISDDDHVISKDLSEEFSEKLGAWTITEHNKGHFTSGVKKISSVLNVILEMDQMNEEEKEMNSLSRLAAKG